MVPQVIHSFFTVNASVCGFEYDDLFQEGCILLCKAAVHYDDSKSAFPTFARTVILNGLKTYCRLASGKQRFLVSLPAISDPDDTIQAIDQYPAPDVWDEAITHLDAVLFLQQLHKKHCGTVRRGIEVMLWKLQGKSGKEIAEMYHVKPTLVGAWRSRALRVLKDNPAFQEWSEQFCQLPQKTHRMK